MVPSRPASCSRRPSRTARSTTDWPGCSSVIMARRCREEVLSTLRKRLLVFTITLAAMKAGFIDHKVPLPGTGKGAMRLCLGMTWDALRRTESHRYLWRHRFGVLSRPLGSTKCTTNHPTSAFGHTSDLAIQRLKQKKPCSKNTHVPLFSITAVGAKSAWRCSSRSRCTASGTTAMHAGWMPWRTSLECQWGLLLRARAAW